jgi:mRNA-degrading endonuclease RelE of RelBE toxin-antitoxin system
VAYKILIDERVLKELSNTQKYPAKIYRQLTLKIFSLQSNPRPPDCKSILSAHFYTPHT